VTTTANDDGWLCDWYEKLKRVDDGNIKYPKTWLMAWRNHVTCVAMAGVEAWQCGVAAM